MLPCLGDKHVRDLANVDNYSFIKSVVQTYKVFFNSTIEKCRSKKFYFYTLIRLEKFEELNYFRDNKNLFLKLKLHGSVLKCFYF